MPADDARRFIRKAMNNPVLRQKIDDAVRRSGIMGYARTATNEGYNCTIKELKSVAKEMAREEGYDIDDLEFEEDGVLRAVIYGEG